MQRVTIGRYNGPPLTPGVPALLATGDGEHWPIPKNDYAGWIEGTRNDGTTWVMFVDGDGNPETYWPSRDDEGAVIGLPIRLTPDGDKPIG